MAKIEIVLRREVNRVRYWDKRDKAWKNWEKSEDFSPPGQWAYKVAGAGALQFIQRTNRRKTIEYSKQIPQGISVWGPEGKVPYTLPWKRKDPVEYVLAVCGIPINAKTLLLMPPEETEVRLATASGRDGVERFDRHVVTDGRQDFTSPGVRVTSPTYVIEFRHYLPWKNYKGRREVSSVRVWPKRAAGGGVNVRNLLKTLRGLDLSHKMYDWEESLYDETFKKPA